MKTYDYCVEVYIRLRAKQRTMAKGVSNACAHFRVCLKRGSREANHSAGKQ